MQNRNLDEAFASFACTKGTALTKKMPARVRAAGANARNSKKSIAFGWNRPTYSDVQMDALSPARGWVRVRVGLRNRPT